MWNTTAPILLDGKENNLRIYMSTSRRFDVQIPGPAKIVHIHYYDNLNILCGYVTLHREFKPGKTSSVQLGASYSIPVSCVNL